MKKTFLMLLLLPIGFSLNAQLFGCTYSPYRCDGCSILYSIGGTQIIGTAKVSGCYGISCSLYKQGLGTGNVTIEKGHCNGGSWYFPGAGGHINVTWSFQVVYRPFGDLPYLGSATEFTTRRMYKSASFSAHQTCFLGC